MMKKFLLSLIICVSSFMIYSNNVKALSYNATPDSSSSYAYFNGSRVNISFGYSAYAGFAGYYMRAQDSSFNSFNTARYYFTSTEAFNSNSYIAFSIYYVAPDGQGVPVVKFDDNLCSNDSNGVLEIPLGVSDSVKIASYSCEGFVYGTTHYIDYAFNGTSYFGLNTVFDIVGSKSDLMERLSEIKTAIENISISPQNIQEIKNNTNDIKNNTNDIKNEIKNDNIDSASSSASSWNSKNASNGVITQLLTLPITLLNAIVSGIQTSCSSFSLGNLFGTDIILPCISLSSLIGNTLFTTIDLLISGFMIYNISKKLIKIFNDFTNLKSNQIDEIYGGGGN